MEELSKEQIEEFREAFSLFDLDNKGEIHNKELGTVLRSLGIYSSDKDKKDPILEQNHSELISFNSFLEILTKKMTNKTAEDELYEAFNLFLTDEKKEIKIENFKKEFKEYLPNIPSSEIDLLCDFLKQEGGNTINIDEAVHKLNSKVHLDIK